MKKTLFILTGLFLFIFVAGVSSQEPLTLDEDQSTVKNLTTGDMWSYRDFISLIHSEVVVFNAGNSLKFEFVFYNEHRTSIPASYRLHLLTDLSSPCWMYETSSSSSKQCDNTWDVWNTFDDHRLYSFNVFLTGTVPSPINEKIYEPGFGEEFELSGIVRGPIRVTLVLFDGKDSIQDFTGDLVFHSTTQTLETMMDEREDFLQLSRDLDSTLNSGFENSSISFDAMREDIRRLGEEGRPGWAKILAEDMYTVYENNRDLTPIIEIVTIYKIRWDLLILSGLIFAVIGLVAGYLLKKPSIPYKELDDATQMIDDIRNKLQLLSYTTDITNLQTEIGDLNSRDLAYLREKMSRIEYLMTKKEPEFHSEPEEGANGEH
jgi:hypothetical protein